MDEIAVSVTFTLPGRVMVTQQAAEKKPTRENLDVNTLRLGINTVTVKTRKCINANQTINMPMEAYKFMTNGSSCPEWCRKARWLNMNSRERFEAHLERICSSLGATSFTYVIHK